LIVENTTSWRSFRAVLQSGGPETAFTGRIESAIDEWLLSEPLEKDATERLICVPQHKGVGVGGIDFALCKPLSGGEPVPRLTVKKVFEVKSNYASQLGELNGRPNPICREQLPRLMQGAIQARNYARHHDNASAYVLYILAKGAGTVPEHPLRDRGWRWWSDAANLQEAINQLEASALLHAGADLKGRFVSNDDFSCHLFHVNVANCDKLEVDFPRRPKSPQSVGLNLDAE
jgi:hypothetical protein